MKNEEIRKFKERADAFLETAIYNFEQVFKKDEIERFRKENIGILTKLSDIYVTSRYYLREFYKEEVEELLIFVKEVRRLLDYD